ncbi:hypothetical protein E4U55_000355 [Claviceps digitariae]|nr:hypothetical protein E4U55_000355 [Claviceps digitariae]
MKSKRAREAATETAEEVLLLDDNNNNNNKHDDAAPTEGKDKKKRKRGGDEESGEQVKQKKAKRDKKDKKKDKKGEYKETRREKKDKRRNLQDLPEEDGGEEGSEGEGEGGADVVSVVKEAGKGKRDGETAQRSGDRDTTRGGDDADADADKDKDKDKEQDQDKKSKKKKKQNKDKDSKKTCSPADDNTDDATAAAAAATPGKPDRHIVFVGNLPFSATAASITAHFASLKPISVRCLKNKGDANPCRGIAFVEFANVWSMRTCLDKFHHTIFEDGVSAGRKINVELTAGGGGSTQFRKDKIRDKNFKLDENRAKRIDKEKNDKQAKQQGAQGGGAAKTEQGQGRRDGMAGGIHPSRLARTPGLGGR